MSDWSTIRDTLDLAQIAESLLGPAPGRRGERGRLLWWHCPLHEDKNPSFAIEPGKVWWKCYGCGASGDSADLVMRVLGLSFPEAVDHLVGARPTLRSARRSVDPVPPTKPAPPQVTGMAEGDALALVEAAAERLWSAAGAEALTYLMGSRGLTEETLRSARLGVTPPLDLPGRPRGIVLAWWSGDRPAMVKIRQDEGCQPKYREVFRDRARLRGIFPGHEVIRTGHPLIVVEGEFDALLLGQELEGLAQVVTLGSASMKPDADILGPLLAATPWYVAHDNDPAGNRAAASWPARARRVRPPGETKDWTDVWRLGTNLRRWWEEVLAGNLSPPLYSWEESAAWRWGPATGNGEGGLVVDRPRTQSSMNPHATPRALSERDGRGAIDEPREAELEQHGVRLAKAQGILAYLDLCGLRARLGVGHLVVDDPKGLLTDEDRQELAIFEVELIELLGSPSVARQPKSQTPENP